MSCLKNDDPAESSQTPGYLVQYHEEAQKCIDNVSLVELVYASYLVTISSIIGGNSVHLAIRYCLQFCQPIVALTKQKKLDEWIELLWRDTLASLYYVHRDSVLYDCSRNQTPPTESLALWEELLETSFLLLVSEADIANLPVSMTTEKICHKIKTLSVYMQLYLDLFLLRINAKDVAKAKSARDHLYTIVDRILRLVSHLSSISDYIHHAYRIEPDTETVNDSPAGAFLHLPDVQPRSLKTTVDPDVRDTALALLYAFARLLKTMLEPTADQVISDIQHSAIAICRLCANVPLEWAMEAFLVKRSLFWAGLILTESNFRQGLIPFFQLLTVLEHLWIKGRLHECRDHHWRGFAIFEREEALLDDLFREADRCKSIKQIWGIEGTKASLFYYTSSLATWFFALNLVRFEDKPRIGRTLEII